MKCASRPSLFILRHLLQSGETVLIGAVRGGHVEIVRALLNKYADIDVRGQVGVLLHYHCCTLSFFFVLNGKLPQSFTRTTVYRAIV